MTDSEAMSLIGGSSSLKLRVCLAVGGLLALFFPGLVVFSFYKGFKTALEKMTPAEQAQVTIAFRALQDL
jgi:hypothetical protein